MSKKKHSIPTISEEDQLDALNAIAQMTPEQQQALREMAEEFEKMPEELQNQMLDFFQMLGEMPDEDREKFLNEMEEDIDSSEDEDGASNDDSDNYPHFLAGEKVQKYTLRVTLRGLKPAIYRKFCVPSNITLRHLSELLLQLMGWEGYHLNQFRRGNNYYAPAYQRKDEIPILFGRAENFNQEDYTLSDLLSEKGKSIEWEYDFGDSWYHDIRLSSIDEYKDGEPRISFIKGERECPPEDCGGIWGYEELLTIHEKKNSHKRLTSEERERLDWYGMGKDTDFDPAFFDTPFAHEICEDFCE